MKSMELRSDVIEYLLADCRYLGEAVPHQLRSERMHLHTLLKSFLEAADELVRYLVNWNADVRLAQYKPADAVYRAATL